jgi:C-terminal processing protease CtpA/Prc
VKDQYSGGELLTDAKIVRCLDNIRHCAIDEQGREVDFLAGIKKRGSHCGLHLSSEKGLRGRKVEIVIPGSPAYLYGIKPGDLITSVDGVTSFEGIGELLGPEQRIGSMCKVNFTR